MFQRLFDFFRAYPIVAYLLVSAAFAVSVYEVDQASIHRQEQTLSQLRMRTSQFCDEIYKVRKVIRVRAIAQKQAFRTLAETTAKFPEILSKEHRQFVNAYKKVTVVPVTPCPPF